MSKQIDERVVSMQFDNKQFESNAKTTLNTLEKLKQSLNLTGASKGLENVGAATKNISAPMNNLGGAVETVRAKFSALQVMGITALTNITNSAVNAGKRIVSALTIQPVTTGFSEYEQKMGSIQTIMASTGESLEVVNQKLNELNEYSDRTIYSFSDMTQNIGKFTNAGVKLDDAVQAIKGISNEAAVSGANANEASRAMYNFAQALSAGYVKLIDWKSIELANMATVEFKEQLIATAVEMGTLTKTTDGYETAAGTAMSATKNFNDSLKDEWMTSEVLISTLKDYADETTEIGKKAYASAQDVKTLTQLYDTLKESAQSGWAQTWEIIVGDLEEAKSFLTTVSKVLGSIIEKTSELRNNFIGGVFKSSWEKITDKITEAGLSVEDFQNGIKTLAKKHNVDLDKMIKKEGSFEKAIQKAFNNGSLDKSILSKALKSLLGETTEVAKAADGLTDSTKDMSKQMDKYGDVVRKVIRGDFGNGKERIDALTKAGYDYATIQNLVNEKLGISVRHTSKLTEEQLKNADSLAELSDKQLKNKGYTDEQIKAIRELSEEADKAGSSISELIDSMDKPSGRELLIDTFSNVWEAISKILEGIKTAWNETFDGNASDSLYNMIDTIHTFSEGLTDIEGVVDKITRIAKGVFAFTQLFSSFGTKLGVIGFNVLRGVLGLTNFDLLELAARLGDAIVKFKNFIFNSKHLAIDLDKVVDVIVKVIDAVGDWIDAFIELPGVQKTITKIKEAINGVLDTISRLVDGSLSIGDLFKQIGKSIETAFNNFIDAHPYLKSTIELVKEWIAAFKNLPIVQSALSGITDAFANLKDNFSDAYEIGKNIIDGIKKGLKDGTMTLGQSIIEIGKMLITTFCTILGIASPSKVFMTLGMFIISGLILGLTAKNTALGDTIKKIINDIKGYFENISIDTSKFTEFVTNIKNKIADAFNSVDWGTVFAGGMSIGMMVLFNKFLNIADKLTGPLGGIGDMFESLGEMFESFGKGIEKTMKAKAMEMRANAILNMAKAILLLSISVALLTRLDTGKLWSSIGALAALAAILGALSFAASKLNMAGEFNISASLLSISASLLILAIALRQLSKIEASDIPKVIEALTAMVFGLGIILLAIRAIADGSNAVDMAKAGSMLLAMAGAMLIMTFVIKAISRLDGGAIVKGLATIAMMELLFIAMIAVSKLAGANAAKAGGMMLLMSGAFLAMVFVIKAISTIRDEDILRGLAAITALSFVFAGLMIVSEFAGKNATKAGGMLLLMSGAFLIMTSVIKQISELSNEEIKRGLKVVSAISVLFAALVAVSKFAGENAAKAGVMLVTMSGAMLLMTASLYLIGKINPDDLKRSLGVVAVLELLFAGLIAVTHWAKDCKTTLIVITVAIGILAIAVTALSFIDPARLKGATIALSSVLATFALLIAATGQLDGAKKMIAPMAIMLVVIAGLAAILWGLSKLEVKTSIANAEALSLLLTALSASLFILSKAGPISWSAIGALAVMGLIVGELAIILGLMSHFNVSASLETIASISILLGVMTGVLVALSLLGPMAATAFIGIGALALLGLVVGELAVILGLMSHFDVNPSIETVKALSLLLASMSGVLVILSVVGLMGPAAFIGVGALATLIVAIGGLIVGIGALVDKFPTLETFLDKGVPILEKIGYAIGSFFGNIIGGFAAGAVSGLPEIGKALSEFMVGASAFIVGIKMVDESTVTGVKALATAVLALTAADFISGAASLLSGGSSLSQLGMELSSFMMNAMPFIIGISAINPEAMSGVKALAETILILTAADIIDGLTSWLTGGASLSSFGEEIAKFGPYMKQYADAVTGIDPAAVEASANAAKALSEIATNLPNTGGLVSWLTGDNDMSTFGTQLATFGACLVSYSKSVVGLDTEAISKSVKAAKSLSELSEALPNTGGIVTWLTGDNNIGDFGTDLATFGACLVSYSNSVVGLKPEAIADSVKAAKSISKLAEALPNTGGIASLWSGDNDISTFGTKLAKFGASLVSYSNSVSEINITNINSSVTATNKLVKMINDMKGIDTSGINSFKDAIKSLAKTKLSDFTNTFKDSSSKVTNIGSNLIGQIAKGVKSSSGSLSDSASSVVAKMVNSIKSKNNDFNKAGSELMLKMASGFAKNSVKAKLSVSSVCSSCITTVKNYYDNFYSAGSYLVSGFSSGISANTWKAEAKAKAMANAAEKAAKEALDINSPSKVFRSIGMSVPEGFAMGIDKLSGSVTSSSTSMARTAIDSVKEAISRVSDIVSGDINTQPTIRPILDLTDVASGASAINGMLGINPSIKTLSNIGAISSMMDGRIQNGSNSDVVSAIRKLGRDMSTMGGNTYNINGVTYDDGSNIAQAIETIVGAIIREGRA